MYMFFMQKDTTANRRVVAFARPNSTAFHFVGYNGGLPTDGNSAPSNSVNFNTQPQGWREVSGGWQNAPLAGNNYGTLFTQCVQGVSQGDSKDSGTSGLWYSQRYFNTESRVFIRNQTNNAAWGGWYEFTKTAVSDERLKNVKGDLNVEGALDNINRMEFKIFSFKDEKAGKGYRRGVISQQIRQIDKEYTKEIGGYYHLDQTPMLLDALAAIKALRARDEANKAEIAELKAAIAELKK
ncbi:tail fiber domain-containing protein [Escherichia coli]